MQAFPVHELVSMGAAWILVTILHVYYTRLWAKKSALDTSKGGSGCWWSSCRALLNVTTGFVSAISLLGFPGEIFSYGTILTEVAAAVWVFVPLSALLFFPTFCRLELTTLFQYVEMRFGSRWLRRVSATIYLLEALLLQAVGVCGASVALSTASGQPFYVGVLVVTASALSYTALGEARQGGWWVDALQTSLLLAFLLSSGVLGVFGSGGIRPIMLLAASRNSIRFLDLRLSPFVRRTSLNIFLGQGFMWASIFICQPPHVMRYMAFRKPSIAFWNLLASSVLVGGVIAISCTMGLVLFGIFGTCDPLTLGLIERADQLLLLFTQLRLDSAGVFGVVGVVVALLVRGACTITSVGSHGLMKVILADILLLTPSEMTKWTKVRLPLTVLIATVICCLTFVVSPMGTFVAELFAITGTFGGPLLGVFLLALLFPCANTKGTMVGLLTGFAVNLWITGGAYVRGVKYTRVPTTTETCGSLLADTRYGIENITDDSNTTFITVSPFLSPRPYLILSPDQTEYITDFPDKMYTLSYALYALVGCLVVVGVGLLLSLLTGPDVLGPTEESCLHPWVLQLRRKMSGCKWPPCLRFRRRGRLNITKIPA